MVASFIEGFEQVGLKVSRGEAGSPGGKTKTVASSKKLEAGLREPMRQFGFHFVEATVYLGLDLKRAGKRNARQHKRVVRLKWRVKRLRQVSAQGKRMAKGVHMVYKQGIKPGAIYGVKCLGMSNRQLEQLRKAAGRAYSTAMQRSLTLQLALWGQDPAHEVTAAPIVAWVSAPWEKRVPRA